MSNGDDKPTVISYCQGNNMLNRYFIMDASLENSSAAAGHGGQFCSEMVIVVSLGRAISDLLNAHIVLIKHNSAD